jgi:molybdopterin-guanine dinucleotide biosynthesis protein A
MGTDKASLVVHTEGDRRVTLLDLALEKLSPMVNDLLVIGHPHVHGHVGPFVIPDDTPGLGPLGGLVTAMRYAAHDRLLVLAVDMPRIHGHLLRKLQQRSGNFTDAVVPKHDGRTEPLVGAYHRRCAPFFSAMLAQGSLRMTDALEAVRTHHVDIDLRSGLWPSDLFHNVNRPEDLDP